jgi:CRP-like cAMP-binding protein
MPAEPFLTSLGEAERAALRAAGHGRVWARGDLLMRTGERADHVVVLTTGFVKISRLGEAGAEVMLGLSGPGDLLGEPAAFQGATRSADATALEHVEGLVIGVPDLRAFLRDHPPAALALLEMTLARLHAADARRIESATAGSLGRVSSRLVELAERFGVQQADGSLSVALPITQHELAGWSAASRESTARALRTLRELGVLETSRRALVIHDLDGLRRHAGNG